jgi:hypothetical protein
VALAAFKLLKCTGTNAATETDCNKHPTFLSADVTSLDTSAYPIAIPVSAAASPNYSYELWLRLECTAAPDNYTQNFKIWGPDQQPDAGDTPGNRMTILIGTTATGQTPTDSASTIATTVQHTNHYSQATGLSVGVEPSDGKIGAIGEKTDYVVLQLKVEDQAQQGDLQTIVFNWSYEET